MTMPSLRTCAISCVLAALGTGAVASEPSTEATTAFAKLKAFRGQWVAKGPQGTTYITYSPAASDSVLLESMTGDKQNTMAAVYPTMMSVYHLDNDRLAMTHYCGQGNQPRMRADKLEGSRLRFAIIDVTNLPRSAASHMVAVTFTFKDARSFRQAWINRADGKEETWTFEFTRVE